MLTIRNAQKEVLEQAAVHDFENLMIRHVEEFFPRHYKILGEPKLRRIVRSGTIRAKGRQLVTKNGVCLFIDLMLMLGSGFDEDLQLPWAAEILGDENIPIESERMNRLYQKAMEYLDQVAGEENEHLHAMLKRRREAVQLLKEPYSEDIEDDMLTRLRQLYPEKYKAVGEPEMRRLVWSGIDSALEYDINTERGVALYICLMFILGSHFDKDIQFDWAASILKDPDITDQNRKVDLLLEEAMSYLKLWTNQE